MSGTHRLPFSPEGTLVRGTFRSASGKGNLPADALDQRLMPNFVEAALPAGSAIAFDSKLSLRIPLPPMSHDSGPIRTCKRPLTERWCACRAGAVWHTSLPNTSGLARRSCYSLYRSSETRGSLTEGRNPTWPAPVSATPSFVRLRIIAWGRHKCAVLGR